MVMATSNDPSGEEPGLQSVATAIGTPCSRSSPIGGNCVSRSV